MHHIQNPIVLRRWLLLPKFKFSLKFLRSTENVHRFFLKTLFNRWVEVDPKGEWIAINNIDLIASATLLNHKPLPSPIRSMYCDNAGLRTIEWSEIQMKPLKRMVAVSKTRRQIHMFTKWMGPRHTCNTRVITELHILLLIQSSCWITDARHTMLNHTTKLLAIQTTKFCLSHHIDFKKPTSIFNIRKSKLRILLSM